MSSDGELESEAVDRALGLVVPPAGFFGDFLLKDLRANCSLRRALKN
jgi:hypothetical protein